MKVLESLAIASAFALSACSGGINSKDDAAKAMNHLREASSSALSGGSAASPSLPQELTQKLTIDGSVKVTGRSGTATVKMTSDASSSGGSATLEITFSGYSADGENTFDGTETYSVTTAVSGLSATVTNSMKANVTISGEYNAKMTCDVALDMSASAASAKSGNVSITLDGTVTADGKSFTFDHETVTVDVKA
jgi:hypothetical protein